MHRRRRLGREETEGAHRGRRVAGAWQWQRASAGRPTHIGTVLSLVCPVLDSSCWGYAGHFSSSIRKPNGSPAAEPLPGPANRERLNFLQSCFDRPNCRPPNSYAQARGRQAHSKPSRGLRAQGAQCLGAARIRIPQSKEGRGQGRQAGIQALDAAAWFQQSLSSSRTAFRGELGSGARQTCPQG